MAPSVEENGQRGWIERLRIELLEIEKRQDLTREQKLDRVIHVGCAVCAGVAVQPIPFADLFILTPLQGVMGVKIANIHGLEISEQDAGEVLKELAGLVGLGLVAQQFVIGIYKFAIPFLGAITTIPLVYGTTYAIGKVMDYYFHQKALKQPIDKGKVRAIWQNAKREGRREGKRNAQQVRGESQK